MTAEGAAVRYAAMTIALRAVQIKHARGVACAVCDWIEREIDAASIDYDLAVALQVAGYAPRFTPPTWWVLPEDVAW